jgi:hypothetical protein
MFSMLFSLDDKADVDSAIATFSNLPHHSHPPPPPPPPSIPWSLLFFVAHGVVI